MAVVAARENIKPQTAQGDILVVDDDYDARDILSAMLTTLGYKVRTAVDGMDALERIEAQPPALIYLDLMMPRLNGFAVLSFLQSSPRLRKIPVVVVSAYDGPSIMLGLPGVSHVICKGDVTFQTVRDTVQSFFSD